MDKQESEEGICDVFSPGTCENGKNGVQWINILTGAERGA